MYCCFFFFNDTATTEIYTLSLHDALPISELDAPVRDDVERGDLLGDARRVVEPRRDRDDAVADPDVLGRGRAGGERSEEHTSELQSRQYLVCRLLLEKKKIKNLYISS